eukprot:s2846_g7.t1
MPFNFQHKASIWSLPRQISLSAREEMCAQHEGSAASKHFRLQFMYCSLPIGRCSWLWRLGRPEFEKIPLSYARVWFSGSLKLL